MNGTNYFVTDNFRKIDIVCLLPKHIYKINFLINPAYNLSIKINFDDDSNKKRFALF